MSYTLATLKSAIQDYTDNTETSFVSNNDLFIKNAEERIFKTVQLTEFRSNATGSLTSSNEFLQKPTDYLASFSLSVTNASTSAKSFLELKDVNFLQEFNPAGSTGFPRFYADFDVDNFLIAPTPNASLSVELHYYYRPTSLTAVSAGAKTWISDNAPLALLYGALVEAYLYMKGEPDILAEYEKRFKEALATLKLYAESKENTDAYRTGLVIRPKQ
jgi:hypothetical protein